MEKSYHAGEFFRAIGDDFSTLEKSVDIINADVLDAWFDPSPKIIEKIQRYLPFLLRTSPPNYSEGLIRTISALRGIPEENIITAEGSSELIFTFFQHMVKEKERVLILDPMYGEYAHVLSRLCHAEVFRHKLSRKNEFVIQPDILVSDIRKFSPKVVVIVNPNSPTGKYLPRETIEYVIRSISQEILIVVDETYIEYAGKENSLEKNIVHQRNLVIIKSMSKVYSLSGARIGYLAAHKEIIDCLSVFIPPWAVSLFGQVAAIEALNDVKYYNEKHEFTHILRREVCAELSKISSIKIYDSIANFYLLELLNPKVTAQSVYEVLAKENIFVRNPDSMSTQFKGRFLRIAVKNQEMNKKITSAFKRILH
jgi:histidinol-phosphate aminotransferase